MNAERLISILVRMLMRKGMRAAQKQAKAKMTPEERAQNRKVSQNSRRAQQALRVSRRIGKL